MQSVTGLELLVHKSIHSSDSCILFSVYQAEWWVLNRLVNTRHNPRPREPTLLWESWNQWGTILWWALHCSHLYWVSINNRTNHHTLGSLKQHPLTNSQFWISENWHSTEFSAGFYRGQNHKGQARLRLVKNPLGALLWIGRFGTFFVVIGSLLSCWLSTGCVALSRQRPLPRIFHMTICIQISDFLFCHQLGKNFLLLKVHVIRPILLGVLCLQSAVPWNITSSWSNMSSYT